MNPAVITPLPITRQDLEASAVPGLYSLHEFKEFGAHEVYSPVRDVWFAAHRAQRIVKVYGSGEETPRIGQLSPRAAYDWNFLAGGRVAVFSWDSSGAQPEVPMRLLVTLIPSGILRFHECLDENRQPVEQFGVDIDVTPHDLLALPDALYARFFLPALTHIQARYRERKP